MAFIMVTVLMVRRGVSETDELRCYDLEVMGSNLGRVELEVYIGFLSQVVMNKRKKVEQTSETP